MNLIFLH